MPIPNSLRAMHGIHKGKMTKTNLFMADLELITEEEGFNAREYDRPDVQFHIRQLAEAYKSGDTLPPLLVKVLDGRLLLRDGYCRYRGALMARAEGAEITRLPIMEVKGDEVEQSLVILSSNDGLKLTALERAKVYARLRGMNLTEEEIATRVRKTKSHVLQYLAVNNLPIKLKDYIKEEVVSWSLALEMFNEHGTEAIHILEKQHAENQGEERNKASEKRYPDDVDKPVDINPSQEAPTKPKRITRKCIDAAAGYRSRFNSTLVRSVTDRIGSVVNHLDRAEDNGDYLVLRLTKEEADELRLLHQNILPPEMQKQSDSDEAEQAEDTKSEDIAITGRTPIVKHMTNGVDGRDAMSP